MIQVPTSLHVLDNSGGKKAMCIKVLKNSAWASIGDVVVVSLKKMFKAHRRQARKVTIGKVYKLLVLQTIKVRGRKDGSFIKFARNGGVLLNRNGHPVGTRVKGCFPLEIRDSSFLKTMSLGPNLI